MSAADLARVLADIDNGAVTVDQHDYIGIPSTIPAHDGESYRLTVWDTLTGSLSMRPAPDGVPGAKRLLLTSIGEHLLRCGNPGRYRSVTAVEVRDAQYGAAAVAR